MKKNKTNFKLMMVMAALLLSPLFKNSGSAAFAQAPNTWTQKANFGGSVRDGAFAFAIGTKGYIGGGNNNGNFYNDVWEYDPTTNVWTQKAGVPANEYLASAFVIGSKAYVGCGYNTGNVFYEFDPVANTWAAKAPLPGVSRYVTMAFSIGSKGYCGTGYNPNSPYNVFNDFYEFDPIANTWTAKANMPGAGRSYAVGFSIGTKGYAGTGNVSANAANDFYEYDPTGNTWTTKANVGPVGRLQSFGIAMNGKGYIGSGGNNGAYGDPNGFYEYDVTANTWTAKANVPVSIGGAVGFAIGAKLYMGTGYGNNYTNEFYEWNSCGPVLNVSPASAFLCGTGSVTLTASGAGTYTWSNGMANGGTATPSVTTHYTVTGALTGTCPSTNSAVVTVVVSTLAVNQTIAPATSTFACNGSTNINLTTEAGVNYYLRNDANNAIIAGPYTGTGSTLNIPTGNFSTTATFNINAKRISGGLTFDGVDDGIRTASTPFNFGGDFTMEAWIKSPVGANNGLNLIFGLPGNPDMWVGLNGGYPAFAIGGPGGNTATGTTIINDGKWHHIAAVRTSGTKNLYVDGIIVATQANANALTSNGFLEVGSYGGSYNFKGQIDEVRVYNTGLTQPQVAASMTACATGSEAGLLLYYNFEDGAGSATASDIAGMDNNATLINMNNATAWSYGVENCIACAATQMTTKPVLTINPIANQTLTVVNPNICVSGTGTITTSGSNINIDYLLRDNSNNAIVSGPLAGTGSALSFTTGNISATKTYNVFARSQTAYLDFDGVDDYVLSTSMAGIPAGNSPYTIEALIKPDAVNGSGTIVSWGNHGATNEACSFRLQGTGQLTNYWWGNDITVGAGNLADGAWHHVAATYDGTTRSIYVDGVLVGSDTPTGHNVTVTNNLTVGGSLMSNNSTFNFYKGGIDEVRVWNIARTQANIQANMSSSLLGSESGLQVYYKFADGTNSATAKDLAGGDNNGTLTNMNTATAWQYYSAPCSLQMSNTPTVTINALPTVSVNNATICTGTSATLVPTGAATYTITGGTLTVSPTANTSYSVTGTSSVGCVSSNTAVATVSVNASPTVSANSATICSGSTVTITPAGANAYTITGGNFTVTPSTTTSYSVTGTATTGCNSNTAVVTVSVNATPTISANSATICSGNTLAIVRSGASTYTITGGTFTVTPATTTSYSVTGTSAAGCAGSNTAVISVSVNASPTITVNSATICSGTPVVLTPAGANTYTVTGGNLNVTPLTTTSYSVTGTGTNNCVGSNTAVSTVSVNTTPTVVVSSGTICAGGSFTLNPAGANTFTISGGNTIVTPAATTAYSITGTSFAGCVSANAIANVTVVANPTITVSNYSVCLGKTVTVVPTGAGTGGTYTISGGSFSFAPTAANIATYSVTGTSSAGCVSASSATTSVSSLTIPVIAVNSNSTVCSGSSVVIVPSGATTYTVTGSNYTVTPLTTTSYSVTGTTNGCVGTNTAVMTVSVNASPTITVNSGAICLNTSLTIVPAGANTYTITGGSFTVSPSANATYSVTGTGTNNCLSTVTGIANVTVNPLPFITVNSAAICPGNTFTFFPTGALTYTYSNGSNTVQASATAGYSITGTSALGCISSNTAVSTVSVVNTVTVSILGNTSICLGETANLLGGGASTYSWSTGNQTGILDVTPVTNTTYTLSGSTGNCTNTAMVTITVNALPVVAVTSGTICKGQTFTITPTGASSYNYSTGTPLISPANNLTFSVTGTSTAGCVSANPAVGTLVVNALPNVTVAPSPVICIGEPVNLTASGASTYMWNDGQTTAAITTSALAANTSFTVTGTDANGCAKTVIVNQVTDNCTAINKISNTISLGLYPNPNNGEFVVESNETLDITVVNALGQVVHTEKTTGVKTNINITHLNNGIYFVKAVANGNQHIVKLIKE